MDIKRIFRHFVTGKLAVKRRFPQSAMAAIENAIRESETRYHGQICFVVEAALDFPWAVRGQSARERALEVFSQFEIWDTEHNNGVLIYLLLADKDVEIVADRGVNAHVSREGWEKICQQMEKLFANGKFEEGVLGGIGAVANHLGAYYPASPRSNELPDKPVVL